MMRNADPNFFQAPVGHGLLIYWEEMDILEYLPQAWTDRNG
jgi:hypothetical protein